jgi:signal transduction histidine kinase
MVRDVSRLRAAEAALAARDAAEADSRAKSALLSRVSHELRTPLNAVLGFAQLMALNPSLDEAGRDQLAQIQRAGWNLVAMIDDLLKLGSIASGQFDAQCMAADVGQIAALALRTCVPQASQRRVELLEIHRPAAPIMAIADPRRLEQVLLNLVSNAIKYSEPGGWVQITLAAASDDVTIAIEDDGIGMDEGQQAQLFQPFNRLGREAGPEAGTGMGLVLAREMVQRMGGRLTIASQPGLGTQVHIHLRRSAPEGP